MALSIGIRAEHLERHPDRSLAALASDPVITFGLELEIVQLSAIRALKRGLSGNALVSGPIVPRGIMFRQLTQP